MKIALYILVSLVVVICALFAWLSLTARTPDAALVDGKLRPCPETPNCVNSESAGETFVEALSPTDGTSIDELWQSTIQSLTEMGANIEKQEQDFVWATFQSRLFRFTDDVELRRDAVAGVIQIRSGSRSGKSDLGINRKRVEALRQRVQ